MHEAGVEALKSASMFAVGVGTKSILFQEDYVVENTDKLAFLKIVERI